MPMLRQTEEVNLLIRVLECSLQSDGWPTILSFIESKLDCTSFLVEFDQSGQPTSRFGEHRQGHVLSDVLRHIQTEGGRDVLQFLLGEASLFYPYCKTNLSHAAFGTDTAARASQSFLTSTPEEQHQFETLLASRGLLSPVWRTDASTVLFSCLFTGPEQETIDATLAADTFRKLINAVRLGLNAFARHETVNRDNQVLSALISDVSGPAVVLTADREVLGTTDGAAAAFSELDIADLHGRGLSFRNKQVEACFQAQAGQAHRLPRSDADVPQAQAQPGTASPHAGHSVFIRGQDGVLRRISIRPATEPVPGNNGGTWFAMRIGEPREIPEGIEGVLQEHFDLSQSEAHLARCLTATGSMSETAKRLGITRNTAKTHLRRIYEKTGVHTQLELASLVHRLSGLF